MELHRRQRESESGALGSDGSDHDEETEQILRARNYYMRRTCPPDGIMAAPQAVWTGTGTGHAFAAARRTPRSAPCAARSSGRIAMLSLLRVALPALHPVLRALHEDLPCYT